MAERQTWVTCFTYAGLRCLPSILIAAIPIACNSGSSAMVFSGVIQAEYEQMIADYIANNPTAAPPAAPSSSWDPPPWILKEGGLGIYGRKLISLNSKTKKHIFWDSLRLLSY